LLSGCGTLTDTIAASTQTFTNTTESSTRVTSSNDSGHASLKTQQAVAFAKINWMQLSANMASGQGEHLSAMADLMGVQASQKPAFYSMTKAKFSQLLPSNEVTPEQLVSRLKVEVSKLNKV
jgi:Protein of unknown function (DUF3015)